MYRLNQLRDRIESLQETFCMEASHDCQACKCHVEEDAGYYCGFVRMRDEIDKITEQED